MSSMRLGWLVSVAMFFGCGDDAAPMGGTDSGSAGTEASATGTGTETSATTGDATSTGATTSTPVGCDGQPCRTGCVPEVCPTADCSGWACSEEGECMPYDAFVCDASILVCEGLSCGDVCPDPFCNDDEDGGMCAESRCDADGVCVPPADFEQNPCTDTTGGGSSGSTG